MIKTFLASVAVAALPAFASAATVLNGGDSFSDAKFGVTAAGSMEYIFTAGEGIRVRYSTSVTPDERLTGFTSIWSSEANGAGTVFYTLNADEENLMPAGVWAAGETRYLTVSWSGVTQSQATVGVVVEASAVPLPAGVVLLGSGLAALGVARRRKA